MTTFYPNQPTPSFLKRYARDAYYRAQHDAHYNGHQADNEANIQFQVRFKWKREVIQSENSLSWEKDREKRREDACKNKHLTLKKTATFAKNNLRVIKVPKNSKALKTSQKKDRKILQRKNFKLEK